MKRASSNRPLLRRLIRALLLLGVFVVAAVGLCAWLAFHDRTPGYELALDISPPVEPEVSSSLRVGFSRVKISPDISDPKRPVYIAGFGHNRVATAIKDDLWAVACVIDDGKSRVGIVSLDAIGFFHDHVVQVRRRASPDWDLDYVAVCATHNHSTPDLMGLWGKDTLHSGMDERYLEQVIGASVSALGEAVYNLPPAKAAMHEIPCPTEGLVADGRPPRVFDADVRVMHFVNAANRDTLGTMVNWGNHPETVWSRNTELTAGFCGFLRDALEKGVIVDGEKLADGLGGVHCFVNGAIGGLMTTSPSVTVKDPYSATEYKEPSHEKARAVAHQLVSRILPQLTAEDVVFTNSAPIGIQARTIEVPMANNLYLLGGFLGVLDRGYVGWRRLRSEVALLTVGEASIACVPGELYPEIANGGVEQPDGRDFTIDPVEIPPLRELMPGRVKFVFGLANDEIGYLLPKTQWDERPPYTYGANRRLYGEINSCGPEAGPTVYRALADLCRLRANSSSRHPLAAQP